MSIEDLHPFLRRKVTIKYAKLNLPVTGELETIVAGAAIIQSPDGVYGMFAHLIERIEEAA